MTTETLNRKAAQLAANIENWEAHAAGIKAKIARLQEEAREACEQADGARRALLDSMRETGATEISISHYRITRHDSPPAVAFDAALGDPVEWLPRELTRTTVSPDKAAIKKAITDGTAPAGCRLVAEQYLKIKRVGA